MARRQRPGIREITNKSGVRWEARYYAPDGKERSRRFATKGAAEAFLDRNSTAKQRGEWINPSDGKVRLATFVETTFLPTLVGLELTSRSRDESYIRTHIVPAFGTAPLATIGYAACQAWVNELATRRAPATVVKAAQIMNKIMATAVRARVVAHNPMAEVRLPTIEESEDVYLTPAQVQELAEAIHRRYRALVYLGCYCGPRIGELAALRWSDVDLLRRTLTINKKVVEVTGHGMVEGATKTKAGRRTVTIPRGVVAELERHRLAYPSDGHVFTTRTGERLRSNNLRRREWAAAVKVLGLDPVPTFHDMRHTAVSLWIAAGASDLEVAKWAGHRSVSFTKDRYAHLFPEHGTALADRLDSFMTTATPTPAAPVVPLRRGER